MTLCKHLSLQDDLLAELEELEQEELESDLLEVGEPTKPLADVSSPLDELPEVRKYTAFVFVVVQGLSLLAFELN